MWDIFKLVKHKDGTYRCRNSFLDILFLLTGIVLLIPAAIFNTLADFFNRLLGLRR